MQHNFPLLVLLTLVLPERTQAQESGTDRPISVEALQRYEPTGISLPRPYVRGKIPVVLVHGLWSNPWSWHQTIEALESDPSIQGHFQFWTFGYSTGDPIPYSAHLLRLDLDQVRRRFDPDRSDVAFDRMVMIGHSMGGLLTKMMAIDPGERLWRVISERPFAEMAGRPDDIALFRAGLLFAPRTEIRRVIFIATPHQGSRLDRGSVQKIGGRLVRQADPLKAAHRRLVEGNAQEFFRDSFRKVLPSSLDELEIGSPMLVSLGEIPVPRTVASHSIIAVLPGSPPNGPTDGLVSLKSARISGITSEKIVPAGHLCQHHPEVIGEVRRILAEHLKP